MIPRLPDPRRIVDRFSTGRIDQPRTAAQRVVARSYTRIAMFDFDGTLFRSWESVPSWWKGTELDKGPYSFFLKPESLDEPCVPDNPPSNYWISNAVQDAKEAISDAGTYTVLITGRVGAHKHRVIELLAQKGLKFDQHYFNPGISATRFKVPVLQNLLIGLNTVSEVEVWENENMAHYDSALRRTALAVERDVKIEIHHIHVPPHELVCGPEDFGLSSQNTGEVRVASKRSPNHVLTSPLRFGLMPVDFFFGEVRERPERKVVMTGESVMRQEDGKIFFFVGTQVSGLPILAVDSNELYKKQKKLEQVRLHTAQPKIAGIRSAAVIGDGTGVGLFIPLPKELSSQFPKKEEDTSPPHITFLYVGKVPNNRENEFLSVLETSFLELDSVKAVLNGLDCFVNPPKGKVVFSRIRLSKDLSKLRDQVWRKLTDAGFEVSDSFPRWNPHTTIEYLDDLEGVWEGKAPQGSWSFSGMEVWGLSKKHEIPFGERVSLQSQIPGIGLQRVARVMSKRVAAIGRR